MTPRLKHWFFDHHLIIAFALLVLVFLLWAFVPALRTWSFLYPAVGAILGLCYFVLKQHSEEIRLVKELFTAFNARYDTMNERLYTLRDAPAEQPLTPDEVTFLYDYFNLCAEEYLFYRKGFIYPEVWLAWCKGMLIFWSCPHIRALWEAELSTDSYYGFTLSCIDAKA
jgi:hypothetical protein